MNNKTVPPAVLFEFVDFVSQGLLCALHAGDLRNGVARIFFLGGAIFRSPEADQIPPGPP